MTIIENKGELVYLSKADVIYNNLVKDIYENGIWDKGEQIRTKYADGAPAYTKSIIGKQVVFEAEDFPMITTKKVTYRSLFAEMWWIWFSRSNDVKELQDMGSSVWDEWGNGDGTIGTAYGYVLQKPVREYILKVFNGAEDTVIINQVDYLLRQLQNNPNSRRHIVSLWSPEDLDGGALEPCVWSSQWIVQEGELNLIVNQRSADLALGVNFNWTQYKLLQMIIAQLSDLKIGKMIWNFGHLHYYDRHEELLLEQIKGKQHKQPTVELADKSTLEMFMYAQKPSKEDLKSLLTISNYENNGSFKYEIAI